MPPRLRVKVGAKNDGRLVAVQTELYGDTGAYASLGEKVMTRATTHSSGPYEVPNVRADCYAMYTNNPPAGAFRGFGVMQSAFAVESVMDMLAERLQLDRIELRRMNALKVGSVTNTGQVLRDSVGLLECIDKVSAEVKRLGGDEPFTVKVDPAEPHKRRAWGFAVAYKNTGLGGGAPDKAGAEVELRRDGMIEVRTSSAELGQGLPTVLGLDCRRRNVATAAWRACAAIGYRFDPRRRSNHRLAPDVRHRQCGAACCQSAAPADQQRTGGRL